MAYQEKKEHKGKKYGGMRVGRSHHWDYPDGRWDERKESPERWEFAFSSHKNRRGKAPQGSGAQVGSGYHWAMVAHQWVRKLDANTYSTLMEGRKYLLSFQKPEWSSWNTQFRNQPSASQKFLRVLEREMEELSVDGPPVLEEPTDLPVLERLQPSSEAIPPMLEEIQVSA